MLKWFMRKVIDMFIILSGACLFELMLWVIIAIIFLWGIRVL